MPYLTNLADVARSAGLTVVEQPGWKTRGHGAMVDVQTVIPHHTAGSATGDAPSLQVVQNGRSDLAGPLAHFLLSRSGVVYVVAAGQCWHTGSVLQSWQGNAHAIGIEAEATGTSAWPEVQMAAFAKLCAALIRAFGLPVSRVLGHKEICAPVGRKIDPNFSMNDFRARVAAALNPSEEDLTPDQNKMLIQVYNQMVGSTDANRIDGWPSFVNPEVRLTLLDFVRAVDENVTRQGERLDELAAVVANLSAQVEQKEN